MPFTNSFQLSVNNLLHTLGAHLGLVHSYAFISTMVFSHLIPAIYFYIIQINSDSQIYSDCWTLSALYIHIFIRRIYLSPSIQSSCLEVLNNTAAPAPLNSTELAGISGSEAGQELLGGRTKPEQSWTIYLTRSMRNYGARAIHLVIASFYPRAKHSSLDVSLCPLLSDCIPPKAEYTDCSQ